MKKRDALIELLEIEKELAKRKARKSLLAFTRWTKPDYRPAWYHKILCSYLDRFASGEIRRLMIFLPPRHGKSELVSRRLPAFLLGKDPTKSIISASYSADLASMMNRDVQRIIDSPEYSELFPETKLNSSNIRTVSQGQYLRNSDLFEIVGKGGIYRSAGVGGGITGMGCSAAIIDDPIKNQQDADSQKIRDAVWEWYTSTLYTRLQQPRSVLLTLTRWHEDDLAGRLLALAKSDPQADQWEVLRLPAICEASGKHPDDIRQEGEALWNEDFGIDTLKSIKASVGSRVWNALYQQRPAPEEGGIVKRSWFKFYTELPKEFDDQLSSWDLAFTGKETSDYVVGQTWGRVGANKYLIDRIRGQMDFPATLNAFRYTHSRNPAVARKLVEDKANGAALIATLKNEISGIIPISPQGDKTSRLHAVSHQIESGNVYLPHPSIAPWVEDFINEVIAFPNAAHDDDVDAMTQALSHLGEPPAGLLVVRRKHG